MTHSDLAFGDATNVTSEKHLKKIIRTSRRDIPGMMVNGNPQMTSIISAIFIYFQFSELLQFSQVYGNIMILYMQIYT